MRVLIELPTWIGDCVMATPSIENLTKIYPKIELIFLGPKASIQIFANHPNCFKEFIFDRRIGSFLKIAKEIGNVDLFISFRGSIRTRLLSFFIKTNRFFQYDKKKFATGHQVEKYNNFMNLTLGIDLKPNKLQIYSNKTKLINNLKPSIGLNPGAKYGSSKCWPPERYAELASILSKDFNIIFFGGADEVELCSIIESMIENSSKKIINLSGKTSIQELINYIKNLDFFITGDSGSMHIAAAFGVPTVSIFGPTKTFETSQWKNKNSRILKLDLDCQPCMKRECPLGHHKCMKDITVKDVLKELDKLT